MAKAIKPSYPEQTCPPQPRSRGREDKGIRRVRELVAEHRPQRPRRTSAAGSRPTAPHSRPSPQRAHATLTHPCAVRSSRPGLGAPHVHTRRRSGQAAPVCVPVPPVSLRAARALGAAADSPRPARRPLRDAISAPRPDPNGTGSVRTQPAVRGPRLSASPHVIGNYYPAHAFAVGAVRQKPHVAGLQSRSVPPAAAATFLLSRPVSAPRLDLLTPWPHRGQNGYFETPRLARVGGFKATPPSPPLASFPIFSHRHPLASFTRATPDFCFFFTFGVVFLSCRRRRRRDGGGGGGDA
jgi:hypothetical protein